MTQLNPALIEAMNKLKQAGLSKRFRSQLVLGLHLKGVTDEEIADYVEAAVAILSLKPEKLLTAVDRSRCVRYALRTIAPEPLGSIYEVMHDVVEEQQRDAQNRRSRTLLDEDLEMYEAALREVLVA